ncbi:MAG TPA: malto-oligosyltrehalose synthase, partial [Actinomycetota bacterium]|nr:malto-oligosyltrehalose synthase [Actinomycetota bacterium]
MEIPRATYRLQLGPSLGFREAGELVAYLDSLGVTHLYLSPILAARRGSAHGYDVVDPTRLNPELGTEDDLRSLVEDLRRRDMALLVDVVPNHMAADPANGWWMDVLARGRASPHAELFDIDWEAPGLEGRVLLPVLGAPLEDVLKAGELSVEREGDALVVRYHEHRFPLAARTAERVLGEGDLDELAARATETPDALAEVLAIQPYELAFWRRALTEGTYRRFFDITDLISLRTEDRRALETTHARILLLVEEGSVGAVRVDHVDGLADPQAYLEWLRGRVGEAYVVVEKILGEGEELPEEWPVAGTTGYEFLNDVTRVLVDGDGLPSLADTAVRVGGPSQGEPFAELVRSAKRRLARELFGADVARVARAVRRLGDAPGVEDALVEVSAALPVYRTYVRGPDVAPRDRRYIQDAVAEARERLPAEAGPGLRLLRDVLLLEGPPGSPMEARLDAVRRWQQLTGPLAAKGVEDTALYRWNRLVALNEVGGDPGAGALDVAAFHQRMARRASSWPYGLNATSTHDTKRSEDVRARIAVLSELPDEWDAALHRWRSWNRALRRTDAPDGAEELLLYQTLVGVWPRDGPPGDDLVARLQDYVTKAAREAKVHTSWVDPQQGHEEALRRFVGDILDPANAEFLRDVAAFSRPVAFHGMLNSLSQLVLKLTAPGVPDLYQGTELWNLRLVDPDNRAPVDFQRRAALLRELDGGARDDRAELRRDLLDRWTDGRLKLFVTASGLRLRGESGALRDGDYLPLATEGDHARHA